MMKRRRPQSAGFSASFSRSADFISRSRISGRDIITNTPRALANHGREPGATAGQNRSRSQFVNIWRNTRPVWIQSNATEIRLNPRGLYSYVLVAFAPSYGRYFLRTDWKGSLPLTTPDKTSESSTCTKARSKDSRRAVEDDRGRCHRLAPTVAR
jgi:hypothetical protein